MNGSDFQQYIKTVDEKQRDVLHMAALFEDGFSLDCIIAIVDIKPSHLLSFINDLITHKIIITKSNSINGPFKLTSHRFIDPIIRIIDTERYKSNLCQATAYLEHNSSDHSSYPFILARLYQMVDTLDNSCKHTTKAADLMVTLHRPDEAIMLYERIINTLLTATPADHDIQQVYTIVASYIPLAVYLMPDANLDKTIDMVKALSSHFVATPVNAILHIALGILFLRHGARSEAIQHCREGRRLSPEVQDPNLQNVLSCLIGLMSFLEGKINGAISAYEHSLGKIDTISLNLNESCNYLVLAWCYGINGRIPLGLGIARAVMERAKLKGHQFTESFANSVISFILLGVQRVKEAKPHIDRAGEVAENIANGYLLRLIKPCMSYVAHCEGRAGDTVELLGANLEQFHESMLVHYPCSWLVELIFALSKAEAKSDENVYAREIKRFMNSPNDYIKGTAFRYHALSISSSEGNAAKIEQFLKKSYSLLVDSGANIEAGKTEIELAKFYVITKDTLKARKFTQLAFRKLSEIDESLFPSQLLRITPRESKDYRKDHGILEIINAVDLFQDLSKYLGRITSTLSDMFGAERSAILIKDAVAPNSAFKVAATHNFIHEEIEPLERSDVQNILLKIMRNDETVTVSDQDDMHIFEALNEHGIVCRSLVLIPIMSHADLVGFIFMDNRLLSGRLSENDIVVLKAIVTIVEIAIKTYGLYYKVKDFKSGVTDYCIDNQRFDIDIESPVIIKNSKRMKDLIMNAGRVASTDTTVLIYGETGVGKELIAHAVHKLSNRNSRIFVAVNISALTESLIESELFGYEKGAFTGATETRPGRFEVANGGTIFLDEIGELPMDVQVKLLRVLQEGVFERVGSSKSIRSDFRLVTATNKNLQQMVHEGKFRSDLFYRLNSFPIEIPPLRERKEDIVPLAMHFMKEYSTKYNKNITRIGKAEIEKVLAYSWPGNVRELEHTIEKAVILSDNQDLQINESVVSNLFTPDTGNETDSLLPLEEIEREHILKVLEHTRWRIRGENGAAKILGIKPTTLEFRMRKIGIK